MLETRVIKIGDNSGNPSMAPHSNDKRFKQIKNSAITISFAFSL